MRNVCQLRPFVASPEVENLFFKNDQNAKRVILNSCHIRMRLLSHVVLGVAFKKICNECIADKPRQKE